MTENPGKSTGGLRKFIVYVFLIGWIAAVGVAVLIVRALVPTVDLDGDLTAIELADTEEANPDGPTQHVLQPLSGPVPAFAASGSIYVPLYNSLYVGGERSLTGLSATFSLRNLSTDKSLIVTSIAYLDSSGAIVADRIEELQMLAPLATAEFYIDQSTLPGGPVATVLVAWGAEAPIPTPISEAVIVGSYGSKSLSFVTRGVNYR